MKLILEDFLAQIAAFCGAYAPTVALVTAVTSALLAAVILYLHHPVLPHEKWAKYFGWAFAIFTFQYTLRTAADFAKSLGFEGDLISFTPRFAQAVGSSANNLCFLVAARLLLSKRKILPSWVPVAAVAAALADLIPAPPQGGTSAFLLRLPDAFFSAYCLVFLGWAMYVNFGPARHPYLAKLNLLGGGLYGLVNLAFAVNPLIASGYIWPDLARRIEKELVVFHQIGVEEVSILTSLDFSVFVWAFVLKVLLFLGALLLIVRILLVLAPDVARDLLKEITRERGKYLTDKGILKALGESTEADLVALCIRLPGVKQERVLWWRWLRVPVADKEPEQLVDLPPEEKSIVAWIMRTGRPEVTCPDRTRDPELNRRYMAYVEGMVSFVTVPIRYHGAVIAVLNLEWKGSSGYSATTVQRIHQVAELLAPTVAFRRQLLSLDRLAEAFHYPSVSLAEAEKEEPRGEPLKKLAEAVHDALTPLATGFLLDLGFRWAFAGCNDQLTVFDISEQDEAQNARQRLLSLAAVRRSEVPEIREESMVVQGVEIGKLFLAINPIRDPVTRPSLADGRLHRRAVASLLADSLLDTVRHRLTTRLNELQVELQRTGATFEVWFEKVETTVREAGLPWAVACVSRDRVFKLYGGETQKKLVGGFRDEVLRHPKWGEPILPFALAEPVELARQVLVLPFEDSDGELWLGLGRTRFTRELSFSSPWRTFLRGLAQTSESALARIERQRRQVETKQLEIAAIRDETTSLLMHSLGHDVGALRNGIQRLAERLPGIGYPVTEDVRNRVEDLRKSAEGLTATFSEHNTYESTVGRVPLINAVGRVVDLYQEELRERDIEITVDIPSDLIVGVPFNVAYFAVETLLVNAQDAIRNRGSISINSSNDDGKVLCHVKNNGPGIRAAETEWIFGLWKSTKLHGRGFGLPAARNALRRHGGDLILASGQEGAVMFTISFPG